MYTTKDMVLFWRTADIYSNWYMTPFEVNGQRYLCVEQFMMAEKARLFSDSDAEARILKATKPDAMKSIGRSVKGYNDAAWAQVREEVVYRGCLEKFKQNPNLQRSLLLSQDKLLVEASPVDRVWGIGLEERDPLAWDQATWRGQNLLGKALMRVRAELLGAIS